MEQAQNARKSVDDELALLKKDNDLLVEKNTLLTKKCEQLESDIKTINKDYEISESERLSMAVKFDESCKYVLTMEQKVYKSNQISLELLK